MKNFLSGFAPLDVHTVFVWIDKNFGNSDGKKKNNFLVLFIYDTYEQRKEIDL